MKIYNKYFLAIYRFTKKYIKGRFDVPEVVAAFIISLFELLWIGAILNFIFDNAPVWGIQVTGVLIMIANYYYFFKTDYSLEIINQKEKTGLITIVLSVIFNISGVVLFVLSFK